MLNILTRKFCPLFTMALFTVGCGKQITDPKIDRGNNSTNYQEISSIYHLSLNSQNEKFAQYRLPEPAQFHFPESVHVLSGTVTNQVLEIAYDVNEEDDSFFLFKCFYTPQPSNPQYLTLNNCVNQSNQSLESSMYDYQVPMRKDQVIQLKFSNPDEASLIVNATHQMNWVVPGR